jgi:uncharacterized protein
LGWNALAVKAIAKAAVVLQNKEYKRIAERAFDFLIDNFCAAGHDVQMMHTWKSGQAKYPAFLDDYAYLADAAIAMYELNFDTSYLFKAKSICKYVAENFSDRGEVFFYYTHAAQDDVIAKKKEIYDGATPSGNSVMAYNLHRLSILFDEPAWSTRAENMLRSLSKAIIKYPSSFGVWASLLMEKINGTRELVVVGENAVMATASIQAGYYIPGKILMCTVNEDKYFPMLRNKNGNDFIQIFLCRNYICSQPFTTEEELVKAMQTP